MKKTNDDQTLPLATREFEPATVQEPEDEPIGTGRGYCDEENFTPEHNNNLTQIETTLP